MGDSVYVARLDMSGGKFEKMFCMEIMLYIHDTEFEHYRGPFQISIPVHLINM